MLRNSSSAEAAARRAAPGTVSGPAAERAEDGRQMSDFLRAASCITGRDTARVPSAQSASLRSEQFPGSVICRYFGHRHLRKHLGQQSLCLASTHDPSRNCLAFPYSVSRQAAVPAPKCHEVPSRCSGQKVWLLHSHLLLDTRVCTPIYITYCQDASLVQYMMYRRGSIMCTHQRDEERCSSVGHNRRIAVLLS